jgi:hypothetical protein
MSCKNILAIFLLSEMFPTQIVAKLPTNDLLVVFDVSIILMKSFCSKSFFSMSVSGFVAMSDSLLIILLIIFITDEKLGPE